MRDSNSKKLRCAWLAGSAIALTATAQTAVAQDTVSAAADIDANEIIVTAQKRAEALQDVPMAIVALTEVAWRIRTAR